MSLGRLIGLFFLVYTLGVIFVLGLFYLAPRPAACGWPYRTRRLGAYLLEVAAAWPTQLLLLPMAVLWPFWWKRGRGRPIVLVHGYGQNRADFWLLAHRLHKVLHRPVFAVNYSFFAPPDQAAKRVARAVERICAQSGSSRVDMVCHSYGGIVARTLIEKQGCHRVARVVTVATPHRGTWWAILAPGRSSRAMTPYSPLLMEMGPPRPPTATIYHGVWSLADAVVSPPDSASLLGAGPQVVFDDLGHLSLLFSKRVANRIADWLSKNQKR